MPIAVTSTGFERTLLEAVKRIMVGIGDAPPSTVKDAKGTVLKAVHAVNDAQEDIALRASWSWRYSWMVITLQAGIMWYDLPEDYGEAATDFPVYLGSQQIPYMDFNELLRRHPDFRQFPPGQAQVNVAVAAQYAQQTSHFGSPEIYTHAGGQIGFFPGPDEDYVAEQSQAVAGYYALPPELVADGDLLQLPKGLWSAHYHLSLALLKQHLAFRDFEADEVRAERNIRRELARHRRRTTGTIRMAPEGET